MRHDSTAMSETKLHSVIAPMTSNLNRGVWHELAESASDQALNRDSLIVIRGFVFEDSTYLVPPLRVETYFPEPTIQDVSLRVPSFYYQVLFDPEALSAIAYVVPNSPKIITVEITSFVFTIDELEELTE